MLTLRFRNSKSERLLRTIPAEFMLAATSKTRLTGSRCARNVSRSSKRFRRVCAPSNELRWLPTPTYLHRPVALAGRSFGNFAGTLKSCSRISAGSPRPCGLVNYFRGHSTVPCFRISTKFPAQDVLILTLRRRQKLHLFLIFFLIPRIYSRL